ncbi:MAG TPA: ATP-binding protein [Blastocatellia bacterium]|nr:ATP-binding protein [Blastocatellia bacterium]
MNTEPGYQPPGTFITHLIKNGFKRHGPVITRDEFEIHNLDLTSLKLNVPHMLPFVVAKRFSSHETVTFDQLEQVLPDLKSMAQSLQKGFIVLALGGRIQTDEMALKELGLSNIVVIDRADIESVNAAPDLPTRSKLLSATLVGPLGRERLSPYISGRPAIGGRFFGRSSTLKRLIPGEHNWTVLGNRRIGKTSLLQEIMARLKLQGVQTAWVYGGKCNSTQDVVYDILCDLDQFRSAEHVVADLYKARNLPSYVHRIADSENKNIALFIDELDHILEFDAKQNFEVLELLRATFQNHEACRIFLAGFRQVMEASRSINHPLFNFTKPHELELFGRDETTDMITRPLSHMGIDLTGTDLPEAVYRQTAGHPELIQIHCAELIRLYEDRGGIPSGPELFGDVFNNEEYKRKVLETFLANTNPYEELLCYLLIKDAEQRGMSMQYEFSPEDVDRVLNGVGYNIGLREIGAIITQLKVSGIITPIKGRNEKYRFSVPQLAGYCLRSNLDFSISKALAAARSSGSDFQYWLDPEETGGGGSKPNA